MRSCLLYALWLVLSVGLVFAQEPGRPRPGESPFPAGDPNRPIITGYVRLAQTDGFAQPLLVRLETPGGSLVAQAWTGSSGRFEFSRLPRGEYVLVVNQAGYKPVRLLIEPSFGPVEALVVYLEPEKSTNATAPGASVSLRTLQIPPQARKEYEEALQELAKKRLEQAVVHLRKAIEIYPNYDDAYLQLAMVHLGQKAFADAQRVLDRALQANPQNARAYALLGGLYRQQNHLPESRRALERSLSLEENSWMAHLELGKTLLGLEQAEAAYPHIARAHQLNPAAASAHILLYNTLILRNHHQAGLAELEEFLRLFPDHPVAAQARQQREGLRAYLNKQPQ